MHYRVSMCIYVYSPHVLEHIPAGRFDFPEVVKALLGAGERVLTFPFDGIWFDIGTPGDHDRAVEMIGAEPDTFLRSVTPTAVFPEDAS